MKKRRQNKPKRIANTLEQLRVEIENGDRSRAVSQILDLIKRGNLVPDLRRMLAYAHLLDGKLESAKKHLEYARSLGTNASTEIAFGRFLRGHQFFDAALPCFESAAKIEPYNLDALALISMTYASLGDQDEAIRHGQLCLEKADAIAQQQGIAPLTSTQPNTNRAGKAKIISYSLFGDNEYYLDCAIAAASIALALFPEWRCRFYCGPEIPENCINSLKRLKAQIVLMPTISESWRGLFWRFLAFDDPSVDYVMVRDVDSPFTLRERLAVEEWLASDYPFHVMRDHLNHMEPIMAGLWGGRTGFLPTIRPIIDEFVKANNARYVDQQFLRLRIWPRIRNITLAHDRYYRVGRTRTPPTHPTQELRHIGFGLPR